MANTSVLSPAEPPVIDVMEQPISTPAPEPWVPLPESFSRVHHKFRNSCRLYFTLQPRTFSSEDTLEPTIQLAIQLDRRLRECHRERSGMAFPHGCSHEYPWLHTRDHPETHVSTPIHDAESRQLGLVNAPLTPEERQRRRLNNLCLYCRGAGHFLQGCPIRPSKWIEPTSVSPYIVKSSHLTLSLFLQILVRIIRVAAIIGSGACSCFIDIHLSKKYGIPLCKEAPAIYRSSGRWLPMNLGSNNP